MMSNKNTIPKSTKRKTILFKAIGIVLPFLFLILVEVALRIVGYGSNTDLFVEYTGDNRYLVLNPDASRKYFVNQELATTGNAELFKKEKDPNVLRIFILGESTTIGYPYFHNASFHRLIQYRLMNIFPGKQFEIINLSLTAVSSYTVLGFAKSLPQYKPDAVLIYSGHNEYYGTLGVASTEKMGNNPWIINTILKIRELRLVQWMTNAYDKIRAVHARDAGTRMKLMVGEEMIAFDTELYRSGIAQFRANMDKTISLLNDHGIPVFVSNLISNERDMKPFLSDRVDSISHPVFVDRYGRGLTALTNNEPLVAEKFFKEAQQSYSLHAMCNFYLGQLALKRGDVIAGKKYLLAAKDLDGLRFRAPSAINDVIEKLCNTYPNAHLVDAQSAFEQRSRDHIVGDELMLEHVHPNLMGYAILSDVFYRTMKTQKVFTVVYEKEMTFDQLVESMPISEVDSLSGLYRVSMLKQTWPFNEVLHETAINVRTPEEKLALRLSQRKIDWQAAMDSLYIYYIAKNKFEKAEKVVEGMVLEHPTEQAYCERVATINAKIGNKDKAVTYFEMAFDLAPSFDKARYLFVLYLQMDKPFEALPYINYGIHNNRSNFNLQGLKEQVEDIIRIKEGLKADSMNVNVISHIAKAYVKMDNFEGANKYVRKALMIDAGNKEARSISVEISRHLSTL